MMCYHSCSNVSHMTSCANLKTLASDGSRLNAAFSYLDYSCGIATIDHTLITLKHPMITLPGQKLWINKLSLAGRCLLISTNFCTCSLSPSVCIDLGRSWRSLHELSCSFAFAEHTIPPTKCFIASILNALVDRKCFKRTWMNRHPLLRPMIVKRTALPTKTSTNHWNRC